MSKAKILKQIYATAKNEIGQFALVTSAIAEKKVNIMGICAWQDKENACFALLTNNNAKAMLALKECGLTVQEEEVVGIVLADKVGAAGEIAKKIKKAGIDLCYVYGSTCGCDKPSALLVLKSQDVGKLKEAING